MPIFSPTGMMPWDLLSQRATKTRICFGAAWEERVDRAKRRWMRRKRGFMGRVLRGGLGRRGTGIDRVGRREQQAGWVRSG